MIKKYFSRSPLLFGCLVLAVLACSSPTQSPEKPRLASLADTTVFATDTIRLIANPLLAPAKIRCFIWSANGGKTFPDSTTVNYFPISWGLADSGIHHVAVKILDSRAVASDSVVSTVIVEICRPVLMLRADSVITCNTPAVFRVTNTSSCRRIMNYMWSFDGGLTFSDTTLDSSITKTWSLKDTGKTIPVYCRATVIPGLVSSPAIVDIRIGYCRPVIHLSGAAFIHPGDTTRFFITSVVACPAKFYLWSFNNGNSFTDTTYSSSILRRWNAGDTALTILVAAEQSADGVVSAPDSLRLSTTRCSPAVRLSGDSAAFAGDSSRFTLSAVSSCSPIAWYLWSFNGGLSFSDTLHGETMVKYWNAADTGKRVIFAKAQTESGEISPADSCSINVRPAYPKVSLPADTSVTAGDTLMVAARVDSSHWPIASFAWTVDHDAEEIMTTSNIFPYSTSPLQPGTHPISVRAIDTKGFSSLPDSMVITSVPVYPTLKMPRDTLLRQKDTLTAAVNATVAGGVIRQYLWSLGSYAWTDSSAAGRKKIWYQGADTVTVRVGARDNRGVMTIDSFHVYFNSPPANVRMSYPKPGDTVIFRLIDSTFKRGAISFKFSATDKNGPRDTVTYRLFMGSSPSSLSKVYEGTDTSWTNAAALDTTIHYWTIIAKDRVGDSAQASGSFTCLLQQTICFAGHSIIVGFGGDSFNGNGGMRGRVLSAMRTRRGSAAKVKPIGPLTTGFMAVKQDDSCFAVASYRAKDLWLLMKNAFPLLNADLWVVMLGVNDAYSLNNEFRQLLWIIDTIHVHNPQAYTYVINGLPNAASYGQDRIFNGWLADSIKARTTANSSWNLWNINAFKKFVAADSVSPNPALFAPENPLLHPNAAGYDTLSKMILDTMKLKFP